MISSWRYKTGAWHAPVVADKEKIWIGLWRDLQEVGTADERRSRETSVRKCRGNSRRAQQQLLMDGTDVESAFALLSAKVTKLAVTVIYFE